MLYALVCNIILSQQNIIPRQIFPFVNKIIYEDINYIISDSVEKEHHGGQQ